jgi:hypothetical protein
MDLTQEVLACSATMPQGPEARYRSMRRHSLFIGLFVLLSISLCCCRPEDPVPPSAQPSTDGRQKFVGVYDVYDTLGLWRYEMEISVHSGVSNIDSILILNLGDSFDVYVQHDDGNNSAFLNLAGHFGILDHEGYRWALFGEYDPLFRDGVMRNDTLRLAYFKDNIAFYVADGVPYLRQSYREFAVKRN